MGITNEYRASHLRRCVVTASGANLQTLVVAALNAQAAGRGDALVGSFIGFRVLTASAGFTIANADNTGGLSATAPYTCAVANGLAESYVSGGATLGVEVEYTGNPTVP